jgi:hypothetical protein
MRSMSLRRLLVVAMMSLLLAAPASSAWFASPVGGIVAPDGGCDDAVCGR